MPRPPFLQSVVDQMVASPGQGISAATAASSPSVFPLRNAPRRFTSKQIAVSSISAVLTVPSEQTLIDFPLGAVLTTSQVKVTLTLDESAYDLKFDAPVLIKVDPSKLRSLLRPVNPDSSGEILVRKTASLLVD